MIPRHQGIDGLTGREPIGAVLAVGVRSAALMGAGSPYTAGVRILSPQIPTGTDRFWFVQTREVGGCRPLHPAFHTFNAADVRHRQMIRGNLVHATRAQCWELSRRAQVLPNHEAHPARAPTCIGDGKSAHRWADDAYRAIPCPNDRCEFATGYRDAKGRDMPAPCKPWMRFLFRPRWEGTTLPSPLVKFTSGSWNTAANFQGFFDHVTEQVRQLRVPGASLYGLPVLLTRIYQTRRNDSGGRGFPVVTITPDCDLLTFLHGQAALLRDIGVAPQLTALEDPEEQEPEILLADYHQTAGPQGIPGGNRG